MAKKLGIYIQDYFAFAPDVAGCHVMVMLNEDRTPRCPLIEICSYEGNHQQMAGVMQALSRFFEGEQFRSINFETGEMMVETTERTGELLLVPSDGGNLREDGIVEYQYEVPHK